MQSRMDKYQTSNKKRYERTQKNTKLYADIYDDIYKDTTYENMKVIDSAKEININKLKDMLGDNYDTRRYRTLKDYSIEDIDIDTFSNNPNMERQRIYDINEIINDAKNKRAFIEEAKEKQKYIEFSERRNRRYDERLDALEKEEQELEELINTMAVEKENVDTLDLLADLKGNDNTIVTNPIDATFDVKNEDINKEITKDIEKTLIKADRTFYTDSNMFTKNDFEDFSTLTRELTRTSKIRKVIIILIIICIVIALAYFGYITLVKK